MEKLLYEPNLQEIVISALLHDIGKFYQRASKSGSLEKIYEENYCPFQNNYYCYKHAGYTAKFFDENKGIFNCFKSYDRIRDISAMHHIPNTIFQRIISISDSISAGVDRIQNRSSEDPSNFRKTPLTSIFSLVDFENENPNNENIKELKTYPINYLGYQTVYPEDNDENIGEEKYSNHYKNFINEIKKINSNYYLFFESSLLRLMEKYLWCIPSATNDELKDISLFDHSYTTASIAATLYLYLKEKYQGNWDTFEKDYNKPINEIISDKNFEFARLLKVDISGIQNYIYDINKAKFSAKMLRARSFEISFMLKGIGQKIKDYLGLDQVNILFEGGGNLLMIIPSNDFYKNKLNEIKKEIEENVFEKYFGELSFIFTLSDSFTLNDFLLDNFNKIVRKNIEQKAEISKLKKNQNVLKLKGHIFHQPYESLAEKAKEGFKICPACDKRISNPKNENGFCDNCKNLVDIGRNLTRSDCCIISKNIFSNNEETNLNLLPNLFLNLNESFNPDNILKEKNHENILQIFGVKKGSSGLRYSNPYHIPEKDEKKSLTFEDLGDNSVGNDKIAMLKGDVNNLGAIFWFGVQRNILDGNQKKRQNILSLSRYSSLSRMFDYFFTEVLVRLIDTKAYSVPLKHKNENNNYENEENLNGTKFEEKEFKYKDRIYVVYSGGDDFVLVGCWDAICEFAKDLYVEFRKYVGENKYINFSGSIEMFNKKTPPLYMAEICEESLSKVKKQKEKYNISIFGELLNWQEYKDSLKNGKKLIEYMFTVDGCSRSFIYRLLKIARMKNDFDEGKNTLKNARYKALFKYSFARNIAEKLKNNENLKSSLEDFFLKEIIEKKGGIVAIQYALQATRDKQKEEQKNKL